MEEASGGTFFLDEIGELDPPIQVKLLRLLQEQEYRRVGGNVIHSADLRVLAATNRNLEEMVGNGSFREDLYHRLNVVNIVLPSLRQRADDIPILLKHFLDLYCAEQGRDEMRFGNGVLEVLCAYDWPGNVRELVNCARYVSSLAQGQIVQTADLPQRLRSLAERAGPIATPLNTPSTGGGSEFVSPSVRYDLPYKQSKRMWLEVFEFAYITNLLNQYDGNVSHAAKAAGIDRKSIQRLLKRNRMSNLKDSSDSGGDIE